MFEYVRMNPPIKVIHTIDMEDVLKVNYWVKYFMRHYGIDNVRGGNYVDPVLPEATLHFLKQEIGTTFSDYERDITVFENVLQTYQSKPLNEEEKVRLENRLKQYNNRHQLLQKFTVSREVIAELEWIREEVDNIRSHWENTRPFTLKSLFYPNRPVFQTPDASETARYKQAIDKVQTMVNEYYSIDREHFEEYCEDPYLRNKLASFEENRLEKETLVVYPHFTLDNFFFHPYVIMNWSTHYGAFENVWKKWTAMAYTIVNWKEELLFDLSKYPANFERETRYALGLYEPVNVSG